MRDYDPEPIRASRDELGNDGCAQQLKFWLILFLALPVLTLVAMWLGGGCNSKY